MDLMHSMKPSRPDYTRFSPILGRLIQGLLIGGPVLHVHQILGYLPSIIQLLLILLLSILLLRLLLSFRRWSDELQHVGKFVRATVALIAVVLLENFCTWYDTL